VALGTHQPIHRRIDGAGRAGQVEQGHL
jgi:hypothetical protein